MGGRAALDHALAVSLSWLLSPLPVPTMVLLACGRADAVAHLAGPEAAAAVTGARAQVACARPEHAAAAAAADTTAQSPCGSDSLQLVQVPHHGSNENVGPTVLDRLAGPRTGLDLFVKYGIVSAAVSGESVGQPSRQVTNAFRRRGTPVYATQGVNLRYAENAPLPGYGLATPLPLYTEVDE